jgi:hypothetical protein
MLGQRRGAFPALPSYTRLVELRPQTLLPLCAYGPTRKGPMTGRPFIDSLPIRVGHNRRIHSQRVLAGLAPRGKARHAGKVVGAGFTVLSCPGSSMKGGAWLGLRGTPGQVDDRRPGRKRVRQLWGKRLGDRGDLRQELFEPLWAQDLPLIPRLKRNRKNKRMPGLDKGLLRQRALIERGNDQRKNISPVEHPRHRRAPNGLVHSVAAVVT